MAISGQCWRHNSFIYPKQNTVRTVKFSLMFTAHQSSNVKEKCTQAPTGAGSVAQSPRSTFSVGWIDTKGDREKRREAERTIFIFVMPRRSKTSEVSRDTEAIVRLRRRDDSRLLSELRAQRRQRCSGVSRIPR